MKSLVNRRSAYGLLLIVNTIQVILIVLRVAGAVTWAWGYVLAPYVAQWIIAVGTIFIFAIHKIFKGE